MTSASRVILILIAMLAGLAPPAPANAFRFSDGSVEKCVLSDGRSVHERSSPGPQGYTGITSPDGYGGFVITWDLVMLNSLPSYAHDFIFYHECAHASVPTSNELQANCVGLKMMREAERSSSLIERQLAAFHAARGYMGPQYGEGTVYWARTLKCANQDDDEDEPDDPLDRGFSTRCRFITGPRAGQIIDYAPRPAIPVGSPCQDGYLSSGIVIP